MRKAMLPRSEPRIVVVSARVTLRERAALRTLASERGLDVSDVIRTGIQKLLKTEPEDAPSGARER
jgi:post-segregation antitoxin (ccd killing protein)